MIGVPFRVVALDFDGVLVDSSEAKMAAYADVFAQYPEHAAALAMLRHDDWSLNRVQFFERAVPLVFGLSAEGHLVTRLVTALSDAMVARVGGCASMPGVEQLFAAIGGAPVYLVSKTPQDDLLRILDARRLQACFAGVFGCPPHSKADALRAIVTRERVAAIEVFFTGDDPTDAEAAAEAGVAFAFTSARHAPPRDVRSFATLAELAPWLASHLASSECRFTA